MIVQYTQAKLTVYLERHYSYECKSTTQDRPYVSRPSRTQQLSDPRLQPKLSSDTPNELLRKYAPSHRFYDRSGLTARRKGVADEELAKKEAERGRKRKFEEEDDGGGRSRSSGSSYSSVSTISTNKSQSPSPDRGRLRHTGQSQLMMGMEIDHPARRSPGSAMSYSSASADQRDRRHESPERKSNGQRKISAGSRNPRKDQNNVPGKNLTRNSNVRQRAARRSLSYDSDSPNDSSHRKSAPNGDGGKRRRRASRSPDDRGRGRDFYDKKGSRWTHSPGRSKDRSLLTRYRKSMTPVLPSDDYDGRSARPISSNHMNTKGMHAADSADQGYSARRRDENTPMMRTHNGNAYRKKERSLSPYSKRIALTQAMNINQ